MVKHVVMWKLREFSGTAEREEAVARIKTGLEGLVGVVEGLLCAQVGENFTEGGFDLCLYTELRDREALAAYQKHPAHLKVREFVHTAITQRVVCDWEA